MNSVDKVRRHFDRDASRFDAIYEERKTLVQRLVDRQRRVVVERFRLIMNLAPLPGVWTALDVGCGPGRYAIALADSGASRVVGIDVAPRMIELAEREALRAGVQARCDLRVSAFAEFETSDRFEVVIATGYFDYVERPQADVDKMVYLCRGRVFASFPKRFDWRVPLRKARFMASGGFVRFYSEPEVRGLFAGAGLAHERLSLIDLGRDWIAVARTQ